MTFFLGRLRSVFAPRPRGEMHFGFHFGSAPDFKCSFIPSPRDKIEYAKAAKPLFKVGGKKIEQLRLHIIGVEHRTVMRSSFYNYEFVLNSREVEI